MLWANRIGASQFTIRPCTPLFPTDVRPGLRTTHRVSVQAVLETNICMRGMFSWNKMSLVIVGRTILILTQFSHHKPNIVKVHSTDTWNATFKKKKKKT